MPEEIVIKDIVKMVSLMIINKVLFCGIIKVLWGENEYYFFLTLAISALDKDLQRDAAMQ